MTPPPLPSITPKQRSSIISLQRSTNELSIHLSAERLGPLNGGTDGTVDDELRKDTERTGDTEEDGVVVLLGEAIVLQEDTGVGVDVGVRVLGLAVLSEDTRSDLVDLADELEHRVIGQMLLSELALGDVAGIGLAKDGMAVTGNDTARLEGRPEVLLDLLVAEIVTDRLLHLLEPLEHFLVGPVYLLAHISEIVGRSPYNPWRGPARPLRPAAKER